MAPSPARLAIGALSTLGAAAVGAGYTVGVARHRFAIREYTLPLLPPGTPDLRILHISDLHLVPRQRLKQEFVRQLDVLEPDLVVNTGDNLADPAAVPPTVQCLGPLLNRPGLFVFGSNDYFAPIPKNPLRYLGTSEHPTSTIPLPWQDLRAAFVEHGWHDATHARREFEVAGVKVSAAGVDDPHLGRDRFDAIGGSPSPEADLYLGLTHSPEPRVLDRFAEDGADLVLAGHTHGGQVCLPDGAAIVTNCGIDRSRAKGVSAWGEHMTLEVSAGLGNSPFAPVRAFCPPEVSLLTLTARTA